jgi:hypothetical protein
MTSNSSISGNVGGASAAGANIQANPSHTTVFPDSTIRTAADANGNYTFSGLSADVWTIQASTNNITTGPLVGWVYRQQIAVQTDGVSAITNVNLQPVAPTTPSVYS